MPPSRPLKGQWRRQRKEGGAQVVGSSSRVGREAQNEGNGEKVEDDDGDGCEDVAACSASPVLDIGYPPSGVLDE